MQAPYPLAMVVCDYIHTDPGTGKHTLLGTFSNIAAREFPAAHPLLCVYITVTDGRGKVPLRLRLVDAEELRPPLFEAVQEITFVDPRMIVEIVMALQNLMFTGPGEYRFQLYADNQLLMERGILLLKVPMEEQKK